MRGGATVVVVMGVMTISPPSPGLNEVKKAVVATVLIFVSQ